MSYDNRFMDPDVDVEKTCDYLKQLFQSKQKIVQEQINVIDNLNSRIRDLESEIQRYEEELLSYRRVSQIIQYEKENNRLQTVVKTLEQKIKSLTVAQEEQPPSSSSSESSELNVYEKKIGSTVYYISDDAEHKIFEKIGDGEIGEELGKLVSVNGRLKPKWNE